MPDPIIRSIHTAHVRLVPLQAPRPSLLDLWARYRFQASTLADLAGVPERTIWAMFYRQPVHRADAQKVLQHLSILLHKVYTLSTVAVVLIDDRAQTARKQTYVCERCSGGNIYFKKK